MKALADLSPKDIGPGAFLLAVERINRVAKQAHDWGTFYLLAEVREALKTPGDVQGELLRQPVEGLIRLVRCLAPWSTSLGQAERALALWAEERRLEREADSNLHAA